MLDNKTMRDELSKAIQILKSGGIVIFPTDTAYGIGCRMDDRQAVDRLIQIRNRPDGKAFPVLVSDLSMAQNYLEPVPKKIKNELVDKYWPGGLTLVLKCLEEKVPEKVRGSGSTLGVRAPNNKDLLFVISELGVPILGPSANFAGGITPFRVRDITDELKDAVDLVLEDDSAINPNAIASTVVDCTREPWEILRTGAVKL